MAKPDFHDAPGKPVKLWLDTSSLHTGLPVATMWRRDEDDEESSETERSDAAAPEAAVGIAWDEFRETMTTYEHHISLLQAVKD